MYRPCYQQNRCCTAGYPQCHRSALARKDVYKRQLPYGCQKVVLTSGENGYGIPELQAVLNEAVAAEFKMCIRDSSSSGSLRKIFH